MIVFLDVVGIVRGLLIRSVLMQSSRCKRELQ